MRNTTSRTEYPARLCRVVARVEAEGQKVEMVFLTDNREGRVASARLSTRLRMCVQSHHLRPIIARLCVMGGISAHLSVGHQGSPSAHGTPVPPAPDRPAVPGRRQSNPCTK
ncbi:MAG TPA: hypothetical protein PKI20_12975 [Verrucomicrobiota bacterium]|nr:hypothetical protein [Verrucomicrobiota bacterium]HQL78629.1 hypothetical protein [Verrucomicrobiota bacterium]